MRNCIFLAMLFFCCRVVAQNALPDSLEKKFARVPRDSQYIDKLNTLAGEYLRTNPGTARTVIVHSLELAPKLNYKRGYARALTVMGNSYWYEGIYEFAQNYYVLAARQYQEINDSTGLSQTYNNIGEVYKKLGDYDKALEYLNASLGLWKKDQASLSMTLYNIGELYIQTNKLKEAREKINQSLALARKTNNQKVIAYDYWGLGLLASQRKQYDTALAYYFTSERICSSLGEIRSMIQSYQDIAEVYRIKRDFDNAEKYLSKAVELADRIKVADLQVRNFLRLSKLDSARGNFSRSLYYLSRHNSLKDSVYNLLKAEQIARLQTIYETEQHERENEQLRAEKTLKESQLSSQKITLVAISVSLLMVIILAWFLYLQRKKISTQKEAIEMQAVALLKLNEELQGLNKNLEARIDERTSQLTIQNQRLTEYTFINAHKLRAPVASILGLINLMHQVDTKEREVIVEHLKTCGEQLDGVIRDLSKNLEDAIVAESQINNKVD